MILGTTHTHIFINKIITHFSILELGVLAATGSNSIVGEIMLHFLIYLWLIQYFTRPPKNFYTCYKTEYSRGPNPKALLLFCELLRWELLLISLVFPKIYTLHSEKKVISVKMFSLLQNYLGRVCLCWKKCTYKGSGCWGVGNQCWQQWFVHLI